MRDWEQRIVDVNAELVGNEGLTVNDKPARESLALCARSAEQPLPYNFTRLS